MANLRDLFSPYYAPDEDAIASALRTGLVTPDTNVMLAAYRFERQARDELFSTFEKLGDRLWIPYQVALEFHRNRLGVIAAQEDFFGKTQSELETAMSSYLGKVRAFANRIAMPQARSQELEQMIRELHAQVTAQVASAEEANEVHLDRRDSDEVLASLEALFDGRVGEPMQPEVLAGARKEAKRRVDNKIPPGYADKDKADPSGDYLVWKQLLSEASERHIPVVLVTDDRKEDWVRREHGLTLGPRPELCEEMSAAAGVPFLLMSTATFLRHAKEYLSVTVSPETVEQARELPDVLDERQRAMVDEMYAQARDEFDRLQAYHAMLETEARAARAEVPRMEAELRAIPGDSLADEELRARIGSELQARRARRRDAEQRLERLRREEHRVFGLLEALKREKEARARGVPFSAVEDEFHEWLIERLARGPTWTADGL